MAALYGITTRQAGAYGLQRPMSDLARQVLVNAALRTEQGRQLRLARRWEVKEEQPQ